MPELPEVHALVADLRSRLVGRQVARFQALSFAAVKTFDPPLGALDGGSVLDVRRHGKFLDFAVDDLHLVVHLARAGWIKWRNTAPAASAGRPGKGPLAARLVLDEGDGFDITEAGTKKSLAIYLVRDPSEVEGIARLGPDPLEGYSEEDFAALLARSGRAQIKGVLRNQSNIAGIGNAYSDEILHVARMSPFKPAAMTPEETHRLFEAMQTTLRDAVARSEGLAASELKREKKSGLRVHGRTGEACPVCGDTVRQVIFHDSTLQYCPTCQTGGKPLADRVLSRLLK
ncbi:DNA-formamidopyrimidine glycosylase family protein [Herbiconiux sp. SYSU D00978]|uniref:DNA-formamidopyrimidine glycosylase family protein n=1 Tax=Herbiconiux sp. SYSU D00978 TaxID=2812562 RepID=UPI001A971DC6|nr:DNA-formamidopyrimidine glycosylase family protein [Herbiconiux sp. SYSU D00978]